MRRRLQRILKMQRRKYISTSATDHELSIEREVGGNLLHDAECGDCGDAGCGDCGCGDCGGRRGCGSGDCVLEERVVDQHGVVLLPEITASSFS